MENAVFQTVRWMHIVTGALALLSGLAAMGLFRITPWHRPAGKVFFYNMTAVFATAVALALWKGIEFLFCLAFLSFYGAYNGVRALRYLKGARVRWFDWTAMASVAAVGCYLAGRGAWSIFGEGGSSTGVLYVFFGALSVVLAFTSGSELLSLEALHPRWFTVHQSSMGAALIATITAFSSTAMDFLPAIVQWLWPTVLLSPVLSYIIRTNPKTAAP